ncbi:hypothetical protein BC829DRAFT_387706 [Chytridium lagenaria]|nr:hypothetical protein BC829DRAFT_387706 [Chytridium lagenaria]
MAAGKKTMKTSKGLRRMSEKKDVGVIDNVDAVKDDLLKWFTEQNIQFHHIDIRVTSSKHGPSFSVWAAEDISQDTVLATIPKDAILSIKNYAEGLGGTMALAIALMFEMGKGKESPWHPYITSFPRHSGLEEDFEEHVLPFIMANLDCFTWFNENTPESKILRQFLHCMSLVSSRGFEVDAYHGHSMFNHRTASEHVHFESDHDVEDDEGESVDDGHSDDDEVPTFNSKDPSHLPMSSIPENEEDDDEIEVEDTIDMKVIRPIHRNEEIFNTYGDLMSESATGEVLKERVAYWEETAREVVERDEEDGEEDGEWEDVEDGDEDDEEMGEDGGYESDSSFPEMLPTKRGRKGQDSGSDAEVDDSDDDDDESDQDPDEKSFHLTPHGLPSPHLHTFLHLCLIPTSFFTRLTPSILPSFIRQHLTPLLHHTNSNDVDTTPSCAVQTGWIKLAELRTVESTTAMWVDGVVGRAALERDGEYEGVFRGDGE